MEAAGHNAVGILPGSLHASLPRPLQEVQEQAVTDSGPDDSPAHRLPEPFSPASNVTDGQSPQAGLEHSDSSKTARRLSASHQALRMFSYLGRPSMRSIQTMVLITYFLMNDNHASDAWAFAGILQRQAYAMGLNRDPSIVKPNAHPLEMQQRRKVWQAVITQDTFLSVIIKLPPTVTHSDVRIEDLLETEDAASEHGASDTSFIRSMWSLASVVQGTICTPRSLDRAVCQNAAERQRLIAHFQRLPPESTLDSVYVQGKTDLIKMVGMMQMQSEHDIVARTRMGVLSNYL
ncbi:MAG: hypothetical protein Q9218_001491 [Villophora microphyllina]